MSSLRLKQVGITSLLFALATGLPQFPGYNAPPTDDPHDVTAICAHRIDDTDLSTSQEIWYGTNAGSFLDNAVANGYDDWVQNIYSGLFNEEAADWDCSTVEGDCGTNLPTCVEFGNAGGAPWYWVFYAISKVHSAYVNLQDTVMNSAITSALDTDAIKADFDGQNPEYNPYAAAGAAFGMATQLSGFVAPEITGLLSFFTGAFEQASANYEPPDPTAGILDQIGNYYNSTIDAIADTLNNAFAGPGGNQDNLPTQTEQSVYKTGVGRFFADGKFLVEDISDLFPQTQSTAILNLRKAIVIRLLKAVGVAILIDNNATTTSECWQSSQVIINGDCFGLFYNPVNYPDQMVFGETYTKTTADGTIPKWVTDKMALSNYSISYNDMYPNAMACMQANPNGDGEVNPLLATTDSIPPCFYNLPVYRGFWDADSAGVWHELPL